MITVNIVFHSWVSNPKNYIVPYCLAPEYLRESATQKKNVTENTMNRMLFLASLTVIIGNGECDEIQEERGPQSFGFWG